MAPPTVTSVRCVSTPISGGGLRSKNNKEEAALFDAKKADAVSTAPLGGGEEGAICSHGRHGVQKFQGAVAGGLVTAGGLWLTRGRAPAVGSVSQTAGM